MAIIAAILLLLWMLATVVIWAEQCQVCSVTPSFFCDPGAAAIQYLVISAVLLLPATILWLRARRLDRRG